MMARTSPMDLGLSGCDSECQGRELGIQHQLAPTSQTRQAVDWPAAMLRLLDGDRLAFLQVSRLITGFLARWGAFDLRSEWDDVVQDVIIAAVLAVRQGRIEKPGAVVAYIRSTTHHKFVDRLRSRRREARDVDPEDSPGAVPAQLLTDGPEGRCSVSIALSHLTEKQRLAVIGVYVEGMTYQQASEQTGVPLGTLKRELRNGLAALRQELSD